MNKYTAVVPLKCHLCHGNIDQGQTFRWVEHNKVLYLVCSDKCANDHNLFKDDTA